MKWKGVKRYCVNLCTTDDQRYDGMAETWFETKQDMDNAFVPAEGQAARQGATDGSREIVILFTEENVMIDG